MSFGPRRPLGGPPRPARPAAVKKPSTVNRPTTVRPDPQKPQPSGKPKSIVASQVARKPAAIPKPSPPKPPTPDPVADYESDFESDESVPSSDAGQSSSSSSSSSSSASDVENSRHSKNSSSNESDDEAEDDDEHGEQSTTRYAARSESNVTVPPPPPSSMVAAIAGNGTLAAVPPPKASRTRANARSMDILSKISLSDVTIDLYRFDPEDYFELRTRFGISTTIAHGKHTQTDTITVSTAQQTSGIRMQTRSTCMQQDRGFRGSHRGAVVEEDRNIDGNVADDDDDEDEVQNYSSLQNIERMFSTLSGALERRFAKPASAGRVVTRSSSANQQRAILQLVRNSAPIFETLLEGRRTTKANGEHRRSLECSTLAGYTGRATGSVKVIRTFDTGKMSPEFEVWLVQESDGSQGFVVECWATGTYTRPTYRFRSWSSVVCVDYDCRTGMMMFGGADDGSLQMWLGTAGQSGPIPPHQIVAPCVEGKFKLKCWEVVTVKVLPMVVVRESSIDTGCENTPKQVFALYSTGIIVVWHVQMHQRAESPIHPSGLSVRLGGSAIALVQSKVIDIGARLGGRVPYDALRSFANLILHDHYQMVVSSDRTVIRLSHFVDSEYDPATLTQPDADHSIVTLKRMAQTTDTLFALYSNKTVRVLKLSTESGRGGGSARARYLKHDSHPNLLLSVCTNKSCTIQSIVHDEAKRRYNGTNNTSEGRADGGLVVAKQRGSQDDDTEQAPRPRFHHGQQILFFGAQHPERILQDERFNGTTGALVQRS
ncbi:uncharacterized protein LOC118467515 [Anopheles albimanus]|uniref:uncharacterized protein LOC118467515 n=1 Tax=Anopheles albimanus TaxID=7167 RepID=UPI001640CF6E|nr:uncharacterized protein LOC118467515 [Anopheles albimanus]XP_035793963.1 uncharacterized protein LOC118467515 [Anopheles albimanus]